MTGRDHCPIRTSYMAIDQEKRGREGIRKTDPSGQCKTTDLAVGGSNPSRRAKSAAQTYQAREAEAESSGLLCTSFVWVFVAVGEATYPGEPRCSRNQSRAAPLAVSKSFT
jgi:hypothetical protein